jgi:hypothetical protein
VINVLPRDFASNVFSLDGMPLSFPENSMRHLYPIYDRPDNAILLKCARQTHKSTTLGYKLGLPCVKYSNYHALYVAPTGNQVSVFSTDKLNGALRGSDVINNQFMDTKTKDQIFYKEMNNGSKIYLRSAFHTADSIRGISADMTAIDEIQDIISDHIPVIEQCMSHSLAKWEHMNAYYKYLPMHLFNCKLYAGTPKTVENTMEKYWLNSTQNEWIIKCKHCKKHNYINERNIGPKCLICNKCGKNIHYENGRWVAMNAGAYIQGYRIPQIILKWINNPTNEKAWKVNVIETQKSYTAEKFYNEILALSYANAKHPLNLAEIKAACLSDFRMITEEEAFDNALLKGIPTFAGIDWGKGDTASGSSYSMISIMAWLFGKPRLLFMKRYTGRLSDPLIQIQDMLRIINRFGCSLIVADTGDGRTSNAMMAKELGASRFGEIYEHGTLKSKLKWDKFKGHYIMNRTRLMTDVFMEIKQGRVDFFNYDQFKEFSEDFLGIYSEYSERTRMTKYDHSVPDDAFHAYMFSRIACGIFRGEYAKYLAGGVNDGEGYDSDGKETKSL